MNTALFKTLLFSLLLLSFSYVYAQTGAINMQNLASVKVDDLSDAQIADFWQQAQSKGVTMAQLQQAAVQRNMSKEEFAKLSKRINDLTAAQSASQSAASGSASRSLSDDKALNADKIVIKSKIFGAELFSNKNLTFEPNLKIATPQNYQIGPDDELMIDVSGSSEANYKLRVSPEGIIRIPVVGPVMVSGLTIEQAKKRIIGKLAINYSDINTGETSVSITLGSIRSIKVTLLGEVNMPGTYTLSSLATTFNALYVSGGPSINGSFRNIKLIRNGKAIATIDIYEFLLKGDAKGNVRLMDQDVIRVGNYETRVEVTGEVKRPGIYEVNAKETLKDVIAFAGGYTDVAYKERIKVYRNTDKEKSVADVPQDVVPMFTPQTGDVYIVEKLLDRFANRVQISGAVFRPGFFALEDGLTLSKLIRKADGLTEDAFMSRGLIYRLKEDNSLEAISFDVKEVMAGKDVPLKREDNIQILSKLKLREEYTVSIAGEVMYPGSFPYADNLKVEDLIIKAGGLRESASKTKIEIARRIKTIDVSNASSEVSTILTYEVTEDLKTRDGNAIVLMPFDVVSVYRLPGFQNQRNVTIEGEVVHPGQYTLTRNNERISEVLSRAGGLTASGFPDGTVLIRTVRTSAVDQYIKSKKLAALQKQSTDDERVNTIVGEDISDNTSLVSINLEKILKNPGSSYDLIMQENDIIRIPRQMQTIKVSGEVLYPVRVQYKSGQRLSKYVNSSGGFTTRALKRKSYIVYANGSAASTKRFLFVFNNYPKVKPGSEIIIPPKEERRKTSVVEIASISSSLATLLLVIYTISSK